MAQNEQTKGISLMDLLHQYHQLEEQIIEAGGALTDELEAALAGNSDAIGMKLDGYAGFINYCKAQAEYLKGEANAFTSRAKTLLNAVDGMRYRMIHALQATGSTKIKTDRHSFSLRTTESWTIKDDLFSNKDLDELIKLGLGERTYKVDMKGLKDAYKNEAGLPEYIEVIPNITINIR